MAGELPQLIGPLASLTAADVDALARLGRPVSYDVGGSLVRQGASDRSVHLLVAGSVKVVVTAADGRSVLLEFCRAGETVGELSAFDGRPRSADVVASTPVRSLRIDGQAFVAFVRARPEVAVALLRAVSRRLRDANTSRLELALEPTVQRVARRVLELAASHGVPAPTGLRVPMPITQAELAAWVGASREGVSDALRQLRTLGAIETGRREIVVHDVATLRSLAA